MPPIRKRLGRSNVGPQALRRPRRPYLPATWPNWGDWSSTFSGATSAYLWDLDDQQDQAQGETWFAPEPDAEGLLPPTTAFNPATMDWDYDASQDVSTEQQWFQPDTEAWTPLPTLTAASVDQQAGLWPEQPQSPPVLQLWHSPDEAHAPPILPSILPLTPSLTGDLWHDHSHQQAFSVAPPWFAPDAEVEGFVPPTAAFDPSLIADSFDPDAQQDRPTTQAWFAPDAAADVVGPIPPLEQLAGIWQEQPQAAGAPWSVQPEDVVQPPAAAGVNPALMDFGYDASQDRSTAQQWFAPDASADGLVPPAAAYDPAVMAGVWQEQPQLAGAPWAVGPDIAEPVLLTPAWGDWSATFSGATSAYLWDLERAVGDTVQQWFAPDAEADGFVPPAAAFDPSVMAGAWQEQPQVATPPWATQPDASVEPIALSFPTTATVAQQAPLWQDQPQVAAAPWAIPPDPDASSLLALVTWGDWSATFSGATTVFMWEEQPTGQFAAPWLFGDVLLGVDATPRFDPATLDWGADPQQDVSLAQRWFAPDLPADGFVPIVSAAFNPALMDFGRDAQLDRSSQPPWHAPDAEARGFPFDPALVDWGWDAQQDRSTAQAWAAPDASADGPVPITAVAFNPATLDWGWDASQDRSTVTTWFAPDVSADGFVPIVAATFNPATMDWGYDAQTDRSTKPTWFQPDDEQRGIPPFAPTVATVPQQAGLWQDQSGQQDRGIGPTWFAPDAAVEPIPPSFPSTASVDQQAPLWQEQPYPLAGNQPRWYDPSVEPVDGPLQSWLFTTGSPGAGGAPSVLINAENGDVFLSIGGPFIVPAS